MVGADVRYIRKYNDGEWVALVTTGEAVAGRFGLTRDIMLVYSPTHELQPAVVTTASKRRDELPRNLSCEDHFILIASRDPHAIHKLHAWSQTEPVLGIHLARSGTPDTIARNLMAEMQKKLPSRNLYDETLPVTGDQTSLEGALGPPPCKEELRQGKVVRGLRIAEDGEDVFSQRNSGVDSLAQETTASSYFRDLESLPQRDTRMRIELVQELRQGLLTAFRAYERSAGKP